MEYPAKIEVQTPETMERWRALVQWILAIPHMIIASALGGITWALWIVSWFSIVFTGRLPEGLASFQIMMMRYTSRAHLYAGFLYTDYPPFDFAMSDTEPGGSPVDISVTPVLEDRDRLRVGLRFLWLIPAALYMFVIAIVGLICWFLAFFAVLFTGRWPEGLRAWVMKLLRVGIRFETYALLLVDEYPPFSTD